MRKHLFLFSILISTFGIAQSQNQITIGLVDSIYSDVLKEQRKVFIYLPEKIDSSKTSKYPVIYLLDGSVYFTSISSIVQQMSSFGATSFPKSIVVAIPNTDRDRDLTPDDPTKNYIDSTGIIRFTAFLENELIPFIDSIYPTLPYRTLVGHSLGGSFVINTLLDHPELFTNYLAIDPGMKFHDYEFYKKALKTLRINKYEGKSLFLTVANTMPEDMDTSTVLKDTSWITSTIRTNLLFAKNLDRISNNKLDYRWSYYPDENHISVHTISAYEGLKYFFRWNMIDLDKIIRTDPSISSESFYKRIIDHYQIVSHKLGYEILPDWDQINDLGYYFLKREDIEGAALFFAFNLDKHPENSNSWDSMGDYYVAKSLEEKATEMFTRAIEIDGNRYSIQKLEELNRQTAEE
ncbi:MAG: alpha/beta hydrolase-fold protein [Bacteroidota bacterium]